MPMYVSNSSVYNFFKIKIMGKSYLLNPKFCGEQSLQRDI
jgi:hypothetical protein